MPHSHTRVSHTLPDDKKICEIMNDEIQHFQELAEAIRLIDPDRLTIREKDLASVLDTSDLETAR